MGARRVRIIFSDADATDSDTDEDASSDSSRKSKIVILHCNNTGAQKNPGGCASQTEAAMRSSAAMSFRKRAADSHPVNRNPGVYERQPGRWVAEFRSHRLNTRRWVGTFDTEQAAKAAYDAFEKQFLSSRRCGLPPPPVSERGGGARARARAAGVHRGSHPHPRDEKRQIVQALTAAGVRPRLPSATASAPCVSSPAPAPPLVPPAPFLDAQPHADAPPSVHSFWADEPADEDLVGLADLSCIPLPFSADGSMDFDPADLSLFDDGFL